MNKIIYIHPAIRSYRFKLFELLAKKKKVDFFWSGSPIRGSHIYEEVNRLLTKFTYKNTPSKELKKFPFDNFSFEMLCLPFSKYDVFIFSNITSIPYLFLALILKVLNKKIILFDELWRYPKEVRKYRLIWPYINFLSHFCLDAVVTAGTKSKDFYVKDLKINREKIFVAYNTTLDTKLCVMDDKIDKKIKNRLKEITSKKKILYLGRIVEYKGLNILIEAMKNISNDYDLIVVGEGEFKNTCQDLSHRLNLSHRIHFLGGCSSYESPYYYKNTDLFVLPTLFRLRDNVQMESWGFTLNEAMALEKPVITTNAVGAAFDLIIENETGAVAEAGDIKSLSNKINLIINLNNDNSIGINARKHLFRICNYNQNFLAYSQAINKVYNE